VRAFFREAPPQLLGGSVVSHDHAVLPRPRRTPLRCGGRARSFSILEVATVFKEATESGLAVSEDKSLPVRCAPPGRPDCYCD
jgi:hypothetical protein